MTTTREIRVLREGSELARQALALFRMPDGAEAAKWGGLVFPLRAGDAIDVSDRGLPPAHCRLWEDEAPAVAIIAERSSSDSYVFIEGSARVCQTAVKQLMDAGCQVLRSGPNLSGGAADWFIRLGAMPEGIAAKLPGLLKGVASSPPSEVEAPLRERLLVQALTASQANRMRLQTELAEARKVAEATSARAQDREALLSSLDAMAARLAEAEAEAGGLRSRLEAEPVVAPVVAPKPNRLEVELGIAATALLPRIDFVRNSLRFISVELPERDVLWKALAALDRQERGLPPAWKSLAGHSGWWERHFSTGQDNQGRIYARAAGTPSRWQVLVSHKQDQPLDLRWIARA